MGNTASRSHIRDAERGVARTTRENTRRNAVPVSVSPHQPPSLSSTSTELQPPDFPLHLAPRSISFPDHSAPRECSPHDAHRLRLQASVPSPIAAPITKRRARHVSADIPFVSPVPQPASPSARSNSAQDSLIAIAPAEPPLLDPSLTATSFGLCHAKRTHTPPRVDKPPRARKVVSFNENVRVVTYPCDNSSGYSSAGEQTPDPKYAEKARRKRGRSVFRLLHRVAGLEPEPASCFSGQYDACCGLLNNAADSAYQDSPAQPQISQTRRLDYQSPKDQTHHTDNDRLSYTTKNRRVVKPPPEAYSLPEGDTVVDDYDYTERQDSLNEPSNLSEPHHPIIEDPIPEAANRSNSSFDISPLWQRLKHVDELDDIDPSRRTMPPRISDPEEDDEVRPVPQPSLHLQRSREPKPSSISHSRRNRPLPKPSHSIPSSAQAKTSTSRQSSKRSVPSVGVDDMTSATPTIAFEDESKQSLSATGLDGPSEIRKTKSMQSPVKHADKSPPIAFPRSASASKPPLPRSRSSACESEPSFAALQPVNHKSASLPSASDRPGIEVQIRGSDRVPSMSSQPDQKPVPTMRDEDPLAAKKPPLPNRKTSQLAEEKKTFMQAIAHAENALQMPTDEITHTTILPIPQPQGKIRDTFEKGSQTIHPATKRKSSDEARNEMEIKADTFGALSSPLTPDSKTEKSFSFKSLQSVAKEAIRASGSTQRSSEARETLSSQVSKAFNKRSTSGTQSPQVHEKFAQKSFGHTKSDSMIPASRQGEVNDYTQRTACRHPNVSEYREHGSEQLSNATLPGLSDIQTTHVEEREVPHVDSRDVVNSGHMLPDASLATSSDIEDSAPSTGNIVPTVVDPNAAEPVALSSKNFRRHSNRISASLRYTYAEDETLNFSALNEEDQLVNEPRSKLSIPKVRSGTSSHANDGNCEDVDIFEAANRAAVDINALVDQSKENDSAVGSLDGLDLEPVVLPGDDDYSVAPMSPMQNFTPVAGIYYGNSSPSEETMSPEETVSDKIGIAEYPEYEVLRVAENENEDSVFGSEPNTPVPKESSGWRDARPKRSRDLSEQVRDSVAVQLASLSSIHGGRGAGDRTTGKMVPEVLLRDWSGNTPIEPTVEVVDSAPNSRSSASHVFRTERFPRNVQISSGTDSYRPGNNSNTQVRDRLQEAKDRLLRVSLHTTDEDHSTQNPSHVRQDVPGKFSTHGFPRRRIGDVIPENEGSTAVNQARANGRLGHSMAFERGIHHRSNERSRTFEPALPKAFAMDPVLQDFQVPVTRKSLSEAGGRTRGLDHTTAFLDEESYAGNTRNVRKADFGFQPPNHDSRTIQLPSNRKQTSDVEHGASAARDESQAFRNVVGRLVNRMQSAKRMLSTS